ncbi:hypothetical protein M8J77_020743 [Diaphorina citri]|nr:hypothetical protein M8J77_020743 [Diaphorina citri]
MSKCDNYRGISLLSVPGKVLSKVLCNRLTPFIDNYISDSQCGFRAERSTIDMIFATRQLVEKTLEQNTSLCVAFIDIRKAFDSVNREALFMILERINCPPNALAILRKLHENTHAAVRTDGEVGPSFAVRTGVRQGCVLAPLLFLVYIQTIVANMSLQQQDGVDIIYRADSDMFSKRGLKSRTKVARFKVAELMFADDCAIVTRTPEALQAAISTFAQSAASLGLQVNEDKTEVMFVNCPSNPISLNGKILNEVPAFKYLGSIISKNGDSMLEIQNRINAASQAFGKLYARVWKPHDLSLKLKLDIYKTVVLSTLLYSSECWTVLGKHIQKLNSFHLRCLRSIAKISWEDRVPTEEVLRRTDMLKIENLIRQRRLRWAGHLSRMPENRIPKKVAFSELETGCRPQCKPKKRWTDILKEDIKLIGLEPKTWRNAAANRPAWRNSVQEAVHKVHNTEMVSAAEKRVTRHEEEENWDWKCPLCAFLRHGRHGRQYVQSHITQCHREEAEARKLTSPVCEHCGFTCGTKSGLTSHLRHRHPDMAAPGLRPLKLHPSSAATPAPPQSAPPPPVPSSTAAAGPSGFICNRCGRVCRSKAGLVSHSKACLRQPPLERRGNVGPTNA